MKATKYAILTLFFFGLLSIAYVSGVTKQQEDYHVFKTVLLKKEGVLDLNISKDSLKESLSHLKSELNSEKSTLEQFKLYSEMIATLGCGHTQIMLNKDVQRAWLSKRNSLPFDMYLIGTHLVVGELDSEDAPDGAQNSKSSKVQTIPVGSEILEIDNRTIDEMMVTMGQYVSSDENTMDFKYHQVSQLFDFYRYLAFPFDTDSVKVTYVTPRKDTNTLFFEPGTAPVNSMNNRLNAYASEYFLAEESFGNFKIVNDEYGYFRFKSFTASSGNDYEDFLKNAFTEISDNAIDKLIFDLRGNTGGVMQYELMRYLVGEDVYLGRYVIEKPNSADNKKYIQKWNIHYLRHYVMSKEQQRKKIKGTFNEGKVFTEEVDSDLVYDGEIVVITDEGTFSSASILACYLKTLKDAKIIGRTAGGSFYAGNAGTLLVKLPQSGFKIAINPNTFYSQLERPENPRDIKIPDVILDPLILDQKKRDQYYFRHAISLFN